MSGIDEMPKGIKERRMKQIQDDALVKLYEGVRERRLRDERSSIYYTPSYPRWYVPKFDEYGVREDVGFG